MGGAGDRAVWCSRCVCVCWAGWQREFTQAEIEFFCQPGEKRFDKFALIKHLRLHLLSSPLQLEGKPATERSLEEAVATGTIANEAPPHTHRHARAPRSRPRPPNPRRAAAAAAKGGRGGISGELR